MSGDVLAQHENQRHRLRACDQKLPNGVEAEQREKLQGLAR